MIQRFLRDQRGQVTIEWTVLAASMGVLAVTIVIAVGDKIIALIEKMLNDLGTP